MTLDGLDDLDRTILHALQRDARSTSSQDIADEADVSASTVRNRIGRLEERG
ncbi:AsnC family transcriptional regulator, partial [Halobacterium salinarum]|nr:AsnC family transcriptional regulator [Halobacterium salinarum]